MQGIKSIIVTFIFMMFLVSVTFAQSDTGSSTYFHDGLTVEYGLGSYAVKDKYISNEKYTGNLPYFRAAWSNAHRNYIYNLDLEFRNSSTIKNNNVSADIYQFSLNQGFLYPLAKRSLFSKDLYIYIGPASEFYFYYNKPDIAVSGFDYAQSFASLFSAGLNTELIYPLSDKFTVESSIRFSVLSLGFRIVDDEEDDASPAKLLTLINGTNMSFGLGARYKIIDNVSVKVYYKSEILRISTWEELLAASDNIASSITYHF